MSTQRPLTVLILGDADDVRDAIRAIIDGLSTPVATTAVAVLDDGVRRLEECEANVVFIVADHDLDRALQVVEQMSRHASPPSVVVLARDREPDSRIRAMRAGASEVLALPIVTEEIALTLARIDEVQRLADREGGGRGAVWTVVSPKEGVGATTLVANLGIELRHASHEVVLVDFDFRSADLAVVLNLIAPQSLADLASAAELDPIFVQSTLVRHQSGLNVLAAPATHDGSAVHLRRERVAALLGMLRATHDYVIVDAPPPISDVVAAALTVSDRIFLPTELTVPCLRAAWRTIASLSNVERARGRLEVLAAKHGPHTADITLAEARSTLRVPLTSTLPRDDANACAALNRGVALADVDSASPLRKAIAALADDLTGRPQEEPRKKGLLGLLF